MPLRLAAAVIWTTLQLPAADIAVKPGAGPTLQEALDQVKAGETNTITIAPGDYPVTKSIVLDTRHNGLMLRGAGPGVRILGGAVLPRSAWKPVPRTADAYARLSAEARQHVLVADLPAGIEPAALRSRGFGRATTPAHTELFVGGERMTLARWPNTGTFERIAATADPDPPDDGHGKRLGRIEFGFHYEGDRPRGWKDPEAAWVHGYWSWDWAETYERVAKLDAGRRLVQTAGGQYGFRAGQRFYFLNVLEELDSPGEYFVDRATRQVYFWPTAAALSGGKEIAVSGLEQPLLTIRGAAGITVDRVGFYYARGNAVEVQDCRNLWLSRLEIHSIGNNGVIVRGGERVQIDHSHVSHTGDGGLELTGGDRATLTAAQHLAADNHLHDFGEWSKTYNPAIRVNGVGNVLSHNLIHDAPHAGIILTGNDHRIEWNEMHHLARETGDVGAFYLGRDYTERGNAVRFNYIHHMGGVGSIGSMAVYLDDCSSGTTVYGNIFYKVQRAAFIGGGRDNTVENNLFIDCTTAVHVDSRGMSERPVWRDMVYKTMRASYERMNPRSPPYSLRYPKLAEIDAYYAKPPQGIPPEGTRIRRNIVFGPDPAKWLKMWERAPEFVTDVGDNVAEEAIGVVNAEAGDFTLKDPELAGRIGFEPIAWREIGPRTR